MSTVEERYRRALDNAIGAGVAVFENYPECCGSCAHYSLGYIKKVNDYAFFVNEQGNALEWKNGMPYHFEMQEAYSFEDEDEEDPALEKYSYPATTIYFHHDGGRAPAVLQRTLTAEGFRVEWNGSMDMSVVLHIDEWTKVIG